VISRVIWLRWQKIQQLNVGGIFANHFKRQFQIVKRANGGQIFQKFSTLTKESKHETY